MKACNACGKCCIKYSAGSLSASQQDLDLWHSFRPEISRYVRDDDIWFDPDSQALLKICPWLRKVEGSRSYHCDIYLDRPEDCRNYPAIVSDMINDECEMLEASDFLDLKRAQLLLDQIILVEQ